LCKPQSLDCIEWLGEDVSDVGLGCDPVERCDVVCDSIETVIDVLRTYTRNTQITPLDLRAAQKQSRNCSTTNKQIKQQYMHVSRDPDELQPLVQGLVKAVGRGFVSQRDEEQTA
jgi:hypothetical protein